MVTRVLIANRGEIAVRVIRACRELGMTAVAVYSDADSRAQHVLLADEAYRIGPPAPGESYLSIPSLIEAARRSGADAVHPGYGFLSERPALASACEAAGLVFIGPSSEAIAAMGSKIAARQLAADAEVPVVPGATPADQSDASVAAAAAAVGFPVLLKPAAGGGGIGMKAVRTAQELPDALAQSRREALSSFGDGTVFVERLLERPRHVEVQVLADHHGQVVHLFERECSVQRRHQKVIEESPSPALTPAVRRRMGAAAVSLARVARYRNAGTVEFLVEGDGDAAAFYFLEMNTRLQVEHPVTEQVTGVDLVHAQLRIAAGGHMPWPQDHLTQRGHAVEARVYAEDPSRGDLPQAGRLVVFREPVMPGVRVDSGFVEGDVVSVHYDPLLAKVIATGESRESARARLVQALDAFVVLGVRTNIPFLLEILQHRAFIRGEIDTGWLAREGDALRAATVPEPDAAVRALADAVRAASPVMRVSPTDPWTTLRDRRV